MSCLETNTVLALVGGGLGADALVGVQNHVADCQSCSDLVAAAAVGAAANEPVPPSAIPSGPSAPPRKGGSIGRYVILDLVGHGGMGEVYAAYDPQLDRKVALKLLHHRSPAGHSPETARARLLREAKAIARLQHPNVVVVYDAGELDGRVFLAMEFVDGQTLAAWLTARPRSWREIRDAFSAAGQGLAAAHDAGLVHRDFKPQNVMVGRDGSLRVMDFGLASDATAPGGTADGDPEPGTKDRTFAGDGPPLAAASDGHEPAAQAPGLTRTGMLIGTPLYMAPEQFLGRAIDRRTDQFSFCVALHHALYGEWPFPTESFKALSEAVIAGRTAPPPQRSRAPAFLRRLLLRGLRPDPADRYPSMAALLKVLRHDPVRRRRRLWFVAAMVPILVLGVLGLERMSGRGLRLCRGGVAKLAGAWELDPRGPRRQAVHRAFMATSRSFAEETWARVSGLLDDYGRGWTRGYADACEATHSRGDQSAEVLDMRMGCLEEARQAVRALTDVYARADGSVLAEAVNAARVLPPLDRCADVPLLRMVVPPPADPATRVRVDDIRARLAEVKALSYTAQWAEALRRVEPLEAAARATGYAALYPEPLEARGIALTLSGDPRNGGEQLEAAVWSALRARRDDLALRAAALLVAVSGYYLPHFEESERWFRLADSLSPRLGPGQDLARAWLIHDHGMARARHGDYAAALEDYRAGLAMKQRLLPPDHHDIAISWDAIANLLTDQGDYAGGLAANDEALRIFERAYGRDNPFLARTRSNRGVILEKLGRYGEAEIDLREAIARLEESGPNSAWIADPLTALGKTLTAEGRSGEAVPLLERALRLREGPDAAPEDLAETRFALARALGASSDDGERGRTLALAARHGYDQMPAFEPRSREVSDWLDRQPGDARLKRDGFSHRSPARRASR